MRRRPPRSTLFPDTTLFRSKEGRRPTGNSSRKCDQTGEIYRGNQMSKSQTSGSGKKNGNQYWWHQPREGNAGNKCGLPHNRQIYGEYGKREKAADQVRCNKWLVTRNSQCVVAHWIMHQGAEVTAHTKDFENWRQFSSAPHNGAAPATCRGQYVPGHLRKAEGSCAATRSSSSKGEKSQPKSPIVWLWLTNCYQNWATGSQSARTFSAVSVDLAPGTAVGGCRFQFWILASTRLNLRKIAENSHFREDDTRAKEYLTF